MVQKHGIQQNKMKYNYNILRTDFNIFGHIRNYNNAIWTTRTNREIKNPCREPLTTSIMKSSRYHLLCKNEWKKSRRIKTT